MRYAVVTAAFIAILIVAGFSASGLRASTGPIPLNCNRACLEGVVNQVLDAMAKHDPKSLPLSGDLMYTENDQAMDIGDGFWKTAEGRGNYSHFFADPEAGEITFMGTMHEAGEALLLSMRVRLELGRITEIESVYYRTRRRSQRDRRSRQARI